MTKQGYDFPYTLGFLTNKNKILMLKRKKEPNKGLWNGVGGKIEAGELPDSSMRREILEETEIYVDSNQLQFSGIVRWDSVRNGDLQSSGMYSYLIYVPDEAVVWESKEVSEGTLEWKDREWVTNTDNLEVVENIPHFLSSMLQGDIPVHCHCEYIEGVLKNITVSVLDEKKNLIPA